VNKARWFCTRRSRAGVVLMFAPAPLLRETVFALHYLAFWMIALQVVWQLRNLANLLPDAWHPPDAAYDWIMRTLLPLYVVLALRRTYAIGWLQALAATLGLGVVIITFNLFVYHAVQFMVTFALT
jgi:hypothetical protein